MNSLLIIAPMAAGLAIVLAYGLFAWVKNIGADAGEMREAGRIRTGATKFFNREYLTMAAVTVVLSAAVWFFINSPTTVFFIFGALFSVFSCLFGMNAEAKGNMKTINAAAVSGIDKALKVAFRSSAVLGLFVAGSSLLGVSLAVATLGAGTTADIICGFGLGASVAALLGCAGVGIYTRTAALGADMFGSCTCALISAIILAVLIPGASPRFGAGFDLNSMFGSLFPLMLASAGLVASMATVMFVRGRENTDPESALNTGIYVSGAVVIICSVFLSRYFFNGYNCAAAVIVGVVTGVIIGKVIKAYAAAPAKELRTGMASTIWFILCIVLCILTAEAFGGLYGIAVAAVGMLSTAGMTLSAGAFGHVPGRGAVAGSAILTSVSMFIAYSQVVGLREVNLLNPVVLAGFLIGAMLPFRFVAMTMKSTGKTAVKDMLLQCLFAVAAPIAVGVLMGVRPLGGMLAGSIASGILITIMIENAGSDQFKDTAAPSVNILIKFMVIISIAFSGLFVKAGALLFV